MAGWQGLSVGRDVAIHPQQSSLLQGRMTPRSIVEVRVGGGTEWDDTQSVGARFSDSFNAKKLANLSFNRKLVKIRDDPVHHRRRMMLLK